VTMAVFRSLLMVVCLQNTVGSHVTGVNDLEPLTFRGRSDKRSTGPAGELLHLPGKPAGGGGSATAGGANRASRACAGRTPLRPGPPTAPARRGPSRAAPAGGSG